MNAFEKGYQAWKASKAAPLAQTSQNSFELSSFDQKYLQWQYNTGRINEEQALAQLNKPYTDFIGQVNNVLSGYDQFAKNYTARFGGRKNDLTDAWVGDSQKYLADTQAYRANLISQTDAILKTLEANPDAFDKDTVDQIKSALHTVRINVENITKAAEQDNAYWSSWGTDDESKVDKILGALKSQYDFMPGNEDSYLTGEAAYARAQQDQSYAKKYEGVSGVKLLDVINSVDDPAEKEWVTGQALRTMAFDEAQEYLQTMKQEYLELSQTGTLRNHAASGMNMSEKEKAAAEAAVAQYEAVMKKYGIDITDEDSEPMEELSNRIQTIQTMIAESERVQEHIKLSNVRENKDFEAYAKKGEAEAMDYAEKNKKTAHMTNKEIDVLAYYIAKDRENGTNLAEQYKESLMFYLKHRRAEEIADWVNDLPGVVKALTLPRITYAATAKTMNWGQDVLQNFSNRKLNQTVFQMADDYIGQDLSGAARIAHQTAGVVGYMAPSILASKFIGGATGVSSLGKAAGSALMFLGSSGQAYGQALEKGYDQPQARAYATLVGLSEVALQNVLGGISEFGGLPAKLEGKIAGIKNALLKSVAKFGSSIGGEIAEEELQNVLEPAFRSIILGEKYDMPTLQEAIDTAIVAALSTGGMEGPGIVKESVKEARVDKFVKDLESRIQERPVTNVNEKKFVDKIVADRVAEIEAETGNKLTDKKKQEIYDQVVSEMDSGRFSVKEIESVLSDTTEVDRLTAERKELKELNAIKGKDLTGEQSDRLAELKANNKKLNYDQAIKDAKNAQAKTVAEMVKSTRLEESYREVGRKRVAYKVENLDQYSEAQRSTIQAAMDSGILNNTRRTHEFVDFIAKVSEKLGVNFSFTDNQRLKESGFALNGVTVNGYVNQDGITINVNSAKALNRVVGHEITHILEGTDFYNDLAAAITTYARTKGEYESRLEQLRELYKDKEGYTGEDAEAKIEAELVADLVGDYIFTDKAFVEKLFQEEPGLFKRIFEEIKYLCKLVTAGSKEARQLEKSKKMFEEAVSEAKQDGVKNPTEEGGVRYSIRKDIVDVNGKQYDSVVELDKYISKRILSEPKKLLNYIVKNLVGARIPVADSLGNTEIIEFAGEKETVTKNKSRHPVLGELAHTKGDTRKLVIVNAKEVIQESTYDPVFSSTDNEHGWLDENGWESRKTYVLTQDGMIYEAYLKIAKTRDGRNLLYAVNLDINNGIAVDQGATSKRAAVLAAMPSGNKVAQANANVNKKSLSDSDGNQLSAGQMEFFQDSKIRDKNGNLKVMYHGSPAAFTVFDKKKARSGGYYGKGFYFTDSDSHAKQYGNAYKVYLNITNPLQDGTNNITKDQLRNFVEAIAENEDYGLDNYGYGATVDSVVDSVYGKSDFAMLMDLNASSIGNMVEAIELFNEVNGTDYNGIIAPTETVAFYPNQIKSVTNTNPTKNEDINLSLSYGKQAETTGGGWNVRGRDISLPMPEGHQESSVAVGASQQAQPVNLPGLEKSQPQSQGKAQSSNLPMPKQTPKDQQTAAREALHEALFGKQQTGTRPVQQTTQQEVEDLDAEFKRQMGDDSSYYDPAEGEEIETARERLEVQRSNLQIELRENQRLRQEMIEDFDQKIEAKQAKYDGKKLKHSKTAQALLRDIEKLKRKKADRMAEYDQAIARNQSRIGILDEKLETNKPEKQDRLEKAYERIDKDRDAAELDLIKQYDAKKAEISKGLDNKEQWIKNKAFDVLWEMGNWVKGSQPSRILGRIWDLRVDGHRLEWDDIKHALADIKDGYTVLPNQAEKAIREVLERTYQDRVTELSALEESFNRDVEKLNMETEEKKKKAQIANIKKEVNARYLYEAAKLAGDISGWKDKNTGFAAKINTLRRNLFDVVRNPDGTPNWERAAAIDEWLQGNYNHNEALLKKEAAELFEKYRKLDINKEESAYIQMLGEFLQGTNDKIKTNVSAAMLEAFRKEHEDKINEEKCRKVVDMARQDYDALFERVNEVLRANGMTELPYVQGYFPHMQEIQQNWIQKILNIKPVEHQEKSTEVAGISGAFKPNKKSQGYSKERKGPETEFNFLKGYQQYVAGVLDWIHHIPDIQRRRALENFIRITHAQDNETIMRKVKAIQESDEFDATEEQEELNKLFEGKTNPLGNFVTDLMIGTNSLAGKKTSGDRLVEDLLNPDANQVINQISSRVSANLVAGSFSAGLSNFAAIPLSWGGTSPISTLAEIGHAFKNTFDKWDDGLVAKSDFLTNRLRNPDKLYKETWDHIGDAVSWWGSWTDNFVTQVIWRSRYRENMKNGMTETQAIKDADIFAENVLAGRSRGNMPTLFESRNFIAKAFTTCQLEVNNQYGYLLKDMPRDQQVRAKNKLVAGFMKVFIGSHMINQLFFMPVTGRRVAFDPITIISQLLMGLIDDEEENDKAILRFVEDVLQEIPLVGGLMGGGRVPVSSALPYDDIQSLLTEMPQDMVNGNWKNVGKEWLNPLYYLGLPMAGGQIKKTNEAISLYKDGFKMQWRDEPGSYTDDGRLKYTVSFNPASVLQKLLFGKWAGQNAQQYIEEGRSPMSQKQTQEFFNLGVSIEEYWDIQDGLKRLNKESDSGKASINDVGDYIGGLDLTTQQKNILINNYAGRKAPIDMATYGDYPNFEEFDYGTQNPGKYAVSQAVGGYEKYQSYTSHINKITADKDENGKTVENSRKQKVVKYINNLDASYGEKIILYVSEYPTKANREKYGADIVEYLNGRKDISRDEMIQILEELGFTVKNGKVSY